LFILNYRTPQVVCGDTVSVVVTVQRESDEEDEDEAEDKDSTVGRVVCPRYGLEKTEAYWLVIGDSNSNALLSIKRITIGEKPSKVPTATIAV
jgi:pre-mRNA-splicing helicase BRR2